MLKSICNFLSSLKSECVCVCVRVHARVCERDNERGWDSKKKIICTKIEKMHILENTFAGNLQKTPKNTGMFFFNKCLFSKI